MRWITALDLEQWAQTIPARTQFPALVADLIRASIDEINSFRFPSGNKGQVRGFDGHLSTSKGAAFVPEGESVWEFGINQGAISKAESDFDKRVKEIPKSERLNMTFVFVTPRAWDNPQQKLPDYVAELRRRGEWKDVSYIDGSMLETWLADNPAVAARYARKELALAPQGGAQSTEEFWDDYASRFKPDLTEAVLLSGRQKEAGELIRQLSDGNGSIIVSADSPDEVVAFAVAAIRTADQDVRAFLEARTLIVDTEEAARFLCVRRNRVFLPRARASGQAGLLAKAGPTLIALGRDQRNRDAMNLPRPSASELGKALETMGFEDEKAYQVARTCGRSVTILARRIPGVAYTPPEWRDQGVQLVPAMLAGAWDTKFDSDKEMLARLAGKPYQQLEVDLRPLLGLHDPPVDRVGSVWSMRAPVDAFVHLGHLVGPEDLDRLRQVVQTVFSRVADPPDPNEPFSLERNYSEVHSSWLRDGLATTLLQIAVLHGEADLFVHQGTAQDYVDNLLATLPGLSQDARLITSLERQLPILMEAAPRPLLKALERLAEGNGELIRPIFNESTDFLNTGSAHTSLLFALEALAWDPTFLIRVSLLLARLARVDPGGRLSNRPINSLREIFLAWSPSTNANLEQRLVALALVIAKEPSVGWDLLVLLFPSSHDSSSPNATPRLREAGASEREVLTYGRVWEAQRVIAHHALKLAGSESIRWAAIIRAMTEFQPDVRETIYGALETLFDSAPENEKKAVWEVLRDEVSRHQTFSHTEWALPTAEIVRLSEVVNANAPSDPVERGAYLFDDWAPHVVGADAERRRSVDSARDDLVRNLLRNGGVPELLRLAQRVRLPHLVVDALQRTEANLHLIESLLVQSLDNQSETSSFAVALSGAGARLFGAEWTEQLKALATQKHWAGERVAMLLLGLLDRRETWTMAAEFGPETERIYWTRKLPWAVTGDSDDIKFAARQFLRVGRAAAALEALHTRVNEVPIGLVFDLLDQAVGEVNSGSIPSAPFAHIIEEIFDVMAERDDVPTIEIAQREMAYLPLLTQQKRTLGLHRLMKEDPSFFAGLLSEVFRPASTRGDQREKPSETEMRRARAALELLNSFKLVPGIDGDTVNATVLRSWVDRVRAFGAESDRETIADQYVGRVLAHAPTDPQDEAWPHYAVREVLESIASIQVERGLMIERHNMRGVYTKGLFEGGAQERALAAQYRTWARACTQWPRTADMLEQIASSWDRDAEREDIRAEQDQLRS